MMPSDPRVCPHCGAPLGSRTKSSDARLSPPHGSSDPNFNATTSNFDLPAADPFLLALGGEPDSDQPGPTKGDGPASSAGVSSGSHSVELLKINLRSRDTIPEVKRESPRKAERQPVDSSDEIEEVRGSVWPLALLASYSSAVTLALVWFVVLPKLKGGSRPPEPAPVVAKSDSGLRAGRSRVVEPVPEVPAEHTTTTGRSLVIGSVEITPLEVSRRPVVLLRNRLIGGVERKEEQGDCLVLRFRLRNVSDNLIFAPYDETFVRDRDHGIADSFVEFGPNTRVYPYPLARESEWSIEGQNFRELKPGETLETTFVSSPEGDQLPGDKLVWRLRLRTGLDKSDLVAVTTNVPES